MVSQKSIVAVDDSQIVLQTLERMLGEHYAFQGFSKAKRALDYIERRPPSLIILDIDMPEMDGYELLELIMAQPELKNIPVIFLTSNKKKDNVIRAVESGADAYVVKPIDKEVLMDKIEALLRRSV